MDYKLDEEDESAWLAAQISAGVGLVDESNPIWDLIGSIQDASGPSDVSEHKHEYLAEGYGDLHDA
jgi:hypothetical protein